MRLLVAVIDTLANDIVGMPMMQKHEQTALRQWDDIVRMDGSRIAQQLNDHEMRVLAYFDDDSLTIEGADSEKAKAKGLRPVPYTLITGKQWLAAQPKQEAE